MSAEYHKRCMNLQCGAVFEPQFVWQQTCGNCGVIANGHPVALQPPAPPSSVDALLCDRQSQYGDFNVQAAHIQEMKSIVRATPKYEELSGAQREAIDCILMKLSRILHGNPANKDSWLDIAGYANLGGGWSGKP